MKCNASELGVISNALSTLGEACASLSRSAHRIQAFQSKMKKEIPNASHQRFKLLRPIRWVDQHDSFVIFKELLSEIVKTLEDFQNTINQVPEKATAVF